MRVQATLVRSGSSRRVETEVDRGVYAAGANAGTRPNNATRARGVGGDAEVSGGAVKPSGLGDREAGDADLELLDLPAELLTYPRKLKLANNVPRGSNVDQWLEREFKKLVGSLGIQYSSRPAYEREVDKKLVRRRHAAIKGPNREETQKMKSKSEASSMGPLSSDGGFDLAAELFSFPPKVRREEWPGQFLVNQKLEQEFIKLANDRQRRGSSRADVDGGVYAAGANAGTRPNNVTRARGVGGDAEVPGRAVKHSGLGDRFNGEAGDAEVSGGAVKPSGLGDPFNGESADSHSTISAVKSEAAVTSSDDMREEATSTAATKSSTIPRTTTPTSTGIGDLEVLDLPDDLSLGSFRGLGRTAFQQMARNGMGPLNMTTVWEVWQRNRTAENVEPHAFPFPAADVVFCIFVILFCVGGMMLIVGRCCSFADKKRHPELHESSESDFARYGIRYYHGDFTERLRDPNPLEVKNPRITHDWDIVVPPAETVPHDEIEPSEYKGYFEVVYVPIRRVSSTRGRGYDPIRAARRERRRIRRRDRYRKMVSDKWNAEWGEYIYNYKQWHVGDNEITPVQR